ncbi:hypothetical protein [Agromyces protaetiae]|uniref:hypothetical protein n=1 Tax=Agromyces protaetiae TaxID=2509455 RepID=UPI0013ED0E31|nr:hypothetical protein [Agromyces protaetiae]
MLTAQLGESGRIVLSFATLLSATVNTGVSRVNGFLRILSAPDAATFTGELVFFRMCTL